MKRLLIPILVLFSALPAFGQGKITFETTTHDFGVFTEGEDADYTFIFKNEGDGDLLVTSVEPSCGCTAPRWSQNPVSPGETGEIRIMYDSKGRPGKFKKSIRVLTDGDPELLVLYIEGEVEPFTLANPESLGNLAFESVVVDWGEISIERKFFLLPVLNTGEAPVRINLAKSSNANLSLSIPGYPIFGGEKAFLEGVFEPQNMPAEGAFEISVELETTDQLDPIKTLVFKGIVKTAVGG